MNAPYIPLLTAFLALFALSASPRETLAQKDVPDVAQTEIARRGDCVEHVVGTGQSPNQLAALAPPADDSNKWFITVLSMRGCPACDRLKVDFARSQYLAGFVNVEDHHKSWAHYNIYAREDSTQAWRFKSIQVRAYPTILVQPPRNGQFGDPKTVVAQITGYDGRPDRLAQTLRNAILVYVQKLQQRQEDEHEDAEETEPEVSLLPPLAPVQGVGQQAPFDVPSPQPLVPNVDVPPAGPFSPQPQPQLPLFPNAPLIQPQIDLGSILVSLLGGMLGGSGMTNVLLIGGLSVGLMLIREIRKARGKPLLLDDAHFDELEKALKKLLGGNGETPSK